MKPIERYRGALLGLATGDAVGTTLEFKPPGSFKPISGMAGGGPFRLKPGEWTDDTSMALCLATSLLETGGFDPKDQMERYCRWWKEGYLSSNGSCFDIGNTISDALRRYIQTGDPIAGSKNPRSAGNGSIMRLAPVPMFYYPDVAAAIRYSAESSRTTHGPPECIDGCRLLAGIICRALSGATKEDVLFGEADSFKGESKITVIAQGAYRNKSSTEIRGTGYVVESLEAALWCFLQTDTFEAAILKAANLGDDADTTAAICGQVAGGFYGESGIPQEWLGQLAMRQEISTLADRLFAARTIDA
jgi:ADP-ribosyl-[dinitrogen reductase] hydrolase